MHSLQKQFHDFIKKQELLNEDDLVLLAVSGGLDSMVMADLFLKSNWRFEVAHCNFNLRGKESDGDEEFVQAWAKENGIQLNVKNFKLGKGSTQINARNARYEWFHELLIEKKLNKVSTAHHLNDSFETSLINLVRGTGVKGLVGMRTQNEKVIRPMLFASKDQLEEYAKENALKWREDSSNQKVDYERNFLRLEVIPKLLELNPSLIHTYQSTSERLEMAAEMISSHVMEVKAKHILVNGSTTELTLDWVETNTDLLILSEILSEYGFSYAISKQIFESLGKPGKQFFTNNLVLSIDRNSLFIKPQEVDAGDLLRIESEGDFHFHETKFRVAFIDKSELNFAGNTEIAFLDADLIHFPLKVRKWRKGDRFTPLGMNDSKKVSDYLIDKKVPLALKDDVLVVQSGDQIAWLVGHQIADGFKISEATRNVLCVSFEDAEPRSA